MKITIGACELSTAIINFAIAYCMLLIRHIMQRIAFTGRLRWRRVVTAWVIPDRRSRPWCGLVLVSCTQAHAIWPLNAK